MRPLIFIASESQIAPICKKWNQTICTDICLSDTYSVHEFQGFYSTDPPPPQKKKK